MLKAQSYEIPMKYLLISMYGIHIFVHVSGDLHHGEARN